MASLAKDPAKREPDARAFGQAIFDAAKLSGLSPDEFSRPLLARPAGRDEAAAGRAHAAARARARSGRTDDAAHAGERPEGERERGRHRGASADGRDREVGAADGVPGAARRGDRAFTVVSVSPGRASVRRGRRGITPASSLERRRDHRRHDGRRPAAAGLGAGVFPDTDDAADGGSGRRCLRAPDPAHGPGRRRRPCAHALHGARPRRDERTAGDAPSSAPPRDREAAEPTSSGCVRGEAIACMVARRPLLHARGSDRARLGVEGRQDSARASTSKRSASSPARRTQCSRTAFTSRRART